MKKHYRERPKRVDSDKSENTRWTQSAEARELRALVLAEEDTFGPKWRAATGQQRDELAKAMVEVMKRYGYISPTTYWRDVDVDRIVAEGDELRRRMAH